MYITTAEKLFESYESFYGMREPPFTLTPNPAFFFLNDRGRECLKQLEYGIARREGFAVICGDVGTGKTTLCWALLEKLEKLNVCTALIQNPMLSPTDILKCIVHDLGIRPDRTPGEQPDGADLFDTSWMSGMGEMELMQHLNTFLARMAHQGLFTVVIIDEAQRLSNEAMEQLRLLSNFELANRKLLQIILVGQLELEKMLQKPELRQLNQRISVRVETGPFPTQDTQDYVRHRLRIACAIPRLRFKRRAFRTVHRLSRGYPRLINMICDRALLCAFQEETHVVTARMVRRGFESLRPLSSRCSLIRSPRFVAALGIVVAAVITFVFAWKLLPPAAGPVSRPAIVSPPGTAAFSTVKSPQPDHSAAVTTAEPPEPPSADVQPAAPEMPNQQALRPTEEYILQTSSFRELSTAKIASEGLKARGIPSFFEYYETKARGGWFGVYAGPYQELATARQAASTLRSTVGRTPVLRRRTVQQVAEDR